MLLSNDLQLRTRSVSTTQNHRDNLVTASGTTPSPSTIPPNHGIQQPIQFGCLYTYARNPNLGQPELQQHDATPTAIQSPVTDSFVWKSYGDTLRGPPLHTSNPSTRGTSNPVHKGDYFSVTMDEEIDKERFEKLRDSLIGLQQKGSKPITLDNLKGQLQAIWRCQSPWELVPLEKRLFECPVW